MTNREIMMAALEAHTFPRLAEEGFTGKYPHFRRKLEDRIELISFQTNKYGGSFTVEVSAVFPGSPDPNYALYSGVTEDSFGVEATGKRYRLPGMYDGWFYYRDLYRRWTLFFGREYFAVPEKQAAIFVPQKGWKLVQKFDKNTAAKICLEITGQLSAAYKWLARFERKHRRK